MMTQIQWAELVSRVVNVIEKHPYGLLVALGMAALLFVWWRRSRYIRIATQPIGSVKISKKVLSGMVFGVYKGIIGLKRNPIVKTYLKKGKICLQIRIQVTENCLINKVITELQAKVYAMMQRNFGAEHVGDIQIRITRCFASHKQNAEISSHQVIAQKMSFENLPNGHCGQLLDNVHKIEKDVSEESKLFKEWQSKW